MTILFISLVRLLLFILQSVTAQDKCEECSSSSSPSEPPSLRFFLPQTGSNNYYTPPGAAPYVYNNYYYNDGFRAGSNYPSQYGYSSSINNNYYPGGGGGGFRTRWNIGYYEIYGYLKDTSNTLLRPFSDDGYIDPERRPRCPVQNFDMLRGGISRSVGYRREHREGRILGDSDEGLEIEIQNNYEPSSFELVGGEDYDYNENSQGRWFYGLKPFRQVPSSNVIFQPGGFRGGAVPSVSSVPLPTRCEGCTWEAELICQLSVRGDGVRWTRYHDGMFYPPGRYHDILDYFGSRARIDTVEDGSLSKLIIYQVYPEDKGKYACENWNMNWGSSFSGEESPYVYTDGNAAQKEILTIDFYPQFPTFGISC